MRRLITAFTLAAAFAGTAVAQEQSAPPRITRQQLQAIEAAAPLLPATVTAIFEVAGESIVRDGMTFIPAQPNVIVARRNDDGTISTTCVTSEKAARAFMQQQQRTENPQPVEK